MRIALVVERLAPAGGGVEQAAWQTAAALTRAGDAVQVFCRTSPEPPEGVGITRIPVATFWQPWRVRAFSRRTSRAIGAAPDGFDVVHSFARTRTQDVYRAGAGRHADFMRQTYGGVGAALRRLSPRHAGALAADRRLFADPTQWIHCPSRLVRDALVARGGVDPARTVVIPNGVDTERYRPGGGPASDRVRSRHAAAGETVWLLAGSGARRKGLDVAIRALARVRDEKTVLWVAGRDAAEPWRRRAARAGVAGRVRFLGARDDMPDVYPAADGLLLPTRYDPCANACLEAAACGLPVVSSAHNGAMEWLDDGGVVVSETLDPAAWARALDALARPEARAALSMRARKRAVLNDWTSHAERLRDLYADVVEQRSGGTGGERA